MKKEQQLLHMFAALHMRVEREDIEQTEMQEMFERIEALFLELSEEYAYDPYHRDEMFSALVEQSKERLSALEEKIKEDNPISHVQEQTKKIYDEIRSFWKEVGFNFISNLKVGSSGIVEVEFSFSFSHGLTTAENKVTKREQIKQTKERLLKEGYLFNDKGTDLIDCDRNKEKLENLITNRFPSAVIFSYETIIGGLKEKKQNIRHINVRIREISDIIVEETLLLKKN